MEIALRLERMSDHWAVLELTRDAFWATSGPDGDEHLLVHRLREVPAFVPELDYVALVDGKIVGNVMYSMARVVDDAGHSHDVLTFGPISVLPEYQRMGVGQALLRHTIAQARKLGYKAIVFYGHPDYYPRVGFVRASVFGIVSETGTSPDALMAMPLGEGGLEGIPGRFFEDPVFKVDAKEAAEFDKQFPHKDPPTPIPMDLLLGKLEPEAREGILGRKLKSLYGLNTFSGREIASWTGIDDVAKGTINATLREHGLPPKAF